MNCPLYDSIQPELKRDTGKSVSMLYYKIDSIASMSLAAAYAAKQTLPRAIQSSQLAADSW